MKKWLMSFDVVGHVHVEVNAETREEAEELAAKEVEAMIEEHDVEFFTSCYESEEITEDDDEE